MGVRMNTGDAWEMGYLYVKKVAYVRYYLSRGLKATSYIQVLFRGYQKSRVRMVVPCVRSHTI